MPRQPATTDHGPAGGRVEAATLVRDAASASRAELLVASLRAFGGELAAIPVRLFAPDPTLLGGTLARDPAVLLEPAPSAPPAGGFPFAAKVAACARAEELAAPGVRALLWLDAECAVLAPPVAMDLGSAWDAAVRPVHHRNVGSPADRPPDAFWRGVYRVTGLGGRGTPPETDVESFADGLRLRAYYNTHVFAVAPSLGLLGRWRELFAAAVADRELGERACADEAHRVFLHQALFSALLAGSVPPSRIRLLPPAYSYPYHLHGAVPPERRARSLEELAIVVREERSLAPAALEGIEVRGALRRWLAAREAPPA